jgi:predicted  nucleic acid-binding Zn-ribbon protein
LQAIASLERRIADLNAEKQYSRREIDDIEHDITNLKKEIVQLKRKHLNYFYFF